MDKTPYSKGNSKTHRRCGQCGKNKLKSSFISNYAKVCNTCRGGRTNKAVKLSTEEKRTRHIASRYNLTPEMVLAWAASQENACAICHRQFPEPNTPAWWATIKIDHNHKTGLVRGILDNLCNATIVRAIESLPDPIRSASRLADYLEENQ